jgi:hypothetical protein
MNQERSGKENRADAPDRQAGSADGKMFGKSTMGFKNGFPSLNCPCEYRSPCPPHSRFYVAKLESNLVCAPQQNLLHAACIVDFIVSKLDLNLICATHQKRLTLVQISVK